MQEIVRVAKDERIVILCTIHQPSTKVYDGFDEVMILSKGREAFTGEVADATSYFEQVGYPLPLQTNPAGKCYKVSHQLVGVSLCIENAHEIWIRCLRTFSGFG